MFEPKRAVRESVARALRAFRGRSRGQVVTWGELEGAAGFERASPHWSAFDRRFRRDFLAATGIALWPAKGVGLELVSHQFQLVQLPLNRQRRALRQITRSRRAVDALPDRELTDHQRAVKGAKLQQLRKVRGQVLGAVRSSGALARSSGGVPGAARTTATVTV